MPATYLRAPVQVTELLAKVQNRFHPRLDNAGVRIGVLMAFAGVKEDGSTEGFAIKGYGGAQAAAKIANVSLKDRVVKGYDAELILDGDTWPKRPEAQQIALLDHELTHIGLTGNIDDVGRPKLKLREEDFIVWGFLEVVQRHGAMALEAQSVKALIDQHGQLLLSIGDAGEAADGGRMERAVRQFRKTAKDIGGSVTISAGNESAALE
jgi:hypothetical protein